MTAPLSIVVPVFNEADNVAALFDELRPYLARPGWQLVLVDDHSDDGTAEAIRACVEALPDSVTAVFLPTHQGKQAALVAGWQACRNALVLTMDGDLQDDPANIDALLEAMHTHDADAVVGARGHRAEPLTKVLPSRVLNALVRRRFAVPFTDVNSPFRLFRRSLVEEVTLRDSEFRFLPVLWSMAGHRVVEIPVVQRPRVHGVSKFRSPWRFLEALFVILTLPGRARRKSVWPRLAVSVALLLLLWLTMDTAQVRQALSEVPVGTWLLLAMANLSVLMIRAARWRSILATWDAAVSYRRALRAYLVGVTLGSVTPMRAGTFARATFVLQGGRVRLSTALGSVLVDRGFDLLVLAALGLPALVHLSAMPGWVTGLVGAGGVVALPLMVGLLRLHPDVGVKAVMLRSKSPAPRALWAPLGFTLLAYAVFFTLAWLLARRTGLEVGLLELTCVLAVVNVLSVAPVTLSGLGAREVAMVALLAPLGVGAAEALSFSLGYTLTFYVAPGLPGLVALLTRPSGSGHEAGRRS